jgi:hypothetical protein
LGKLETGSKSIGGKKFASVKRAALIEFGFIMDIRITG